MDSNGYNESILTPYCYHACEQKARHEVFHGAYREKSKDKGLWLELCPECHNKVHHGLLKNGKPLDIALKERAQREAMAYHGWTKEEFIELFGKNYIDDKEKNKNA